LKTTFRKKLIFAAVTTICVVAAGYLFLANLFSFDYGFGLAFDAERGEAVVSRIQPSGAADRAGLQEGDVLLQFDDRVPESPGDCVSCTSYALSMPSITLKTRRAGVLTDVTLTGVSNTQTAMLYVMALIGLVYVVMGCWVFFARPQYRAANSWGYFSMLMGVLLLPEGLHGDPNDIGFLIAAFLVFGAAIFSSACVLDFALVFPMPRGLALRPWTLPLVYGTAGLLMLGYLVIVFLSRLSNNAQNFLQVALGTYYGVLITIYIVYIALAVATLLATYLRTGEIEEKRRIRWIIFGTSIPLASLALMMLLENIVGFGLPLPEWILAISLLFIPLANFYAIVRYRAMQMELILRRGLVYTLVTGAVLLVTGAVFAVVFGLLFIVQDLLPQTGGAQNSIDRFLLDPNVQRVAIAAWALLIGVTLGRLKRRVQEFVDKRFYRQKYNYKLALRELTSVLDRAADRQNMLRIVIENAERMVHPKSVAVALIANGGEAGVECATPKALLGTTLESTAVEDLKRTFDRSRKFLGLRELSEERSSGDGRARDSFVRLGADICLPIRRESKIIGFLFLGAKLSEQEYNFEDIDLLGLLADQTAHGLEHQRLAAEAAEKERIQRELQIGREIQQSMLPAAPPRLKGASVAALSLPAEEVGGDFYTFIEYGAKRLGIIVGDIVGKGVAGAINMAATISSVRLIAEESASVSETMQRLNRYLVRNTSARSFAAVMYAVIDLEEKKIRWSNAGVPEPILIPAEGSAHFLEMESYPLPPGASSRSAYVEAEANLKRGDTIVLVTDGVVEIRSKDESRSELGYEGLLSLLSVTGPREPKKLLDSLASSLRKFRGDETFEDDITAVAVHINS